MNWSKGFTATYYAYVIDPDSWRETERIYIVGGSIKREEDGLRQSANIDCKGYAPELEQWVRVYLDTEQEGASAHEALFTGIATSPGWDYNGVVRSDTLECYSVLKPAEDVLAKRGAYLPAGTNGARAVAALLAVCPCPIVIEGESDNLQEAIIAEDDETNLSLADKVLAAINWRLRITGDGTVTICPPAEDESGSFDEINNDAVELDVSVQRDLFSCPNVFQAISGDMTAIARDDSVDSILSTVNRKREVWAQENDCDLSTGESIAEYARRRLGELQTIALTASYKRRFYPAILPTDLVALNFPKQQMAGTFRVTSQTIDLGYGASTSEEVTTTAKLPEVKRDRGPIPAQTYTLIDSAGNAIVTDDGDNILIVG